MSTYALLSRCNSLLLPHSVSKLRAEINFVIMHQMHTVCGYKHTFALPLLK